MPRSLCTAVRRHLAYHPLTPPGLSVAKTARQLGVSAPGIAMAVARTNARYVHFVSYGRVPHSSTVTFRQRSASASQRLHRLNSLDRVLSVRQPASPTLFPTAPGAWSERRPG